MCRLAAAMLHERMFISGGTYLRCTAAITTVHVMSRKTGCLSGTLS